jgi:hypothetical protein
MNKKLSLIAALMFAQSSSASIIDFGGFTRDTETNIDWLDLTATRGFTSSQISSLLGQGWNIASNADVVQLVNNYAGLSLPVYIGGGAQYSYMPYGTVSGLADLLGITFVQSSGGVTYHATGYIAEDWTSGSSHYRYADSIGYTVMPDGYRFDQLGQQWYAYADRFSDGFTGWYLTRDVPSSVPLPPTFFLMVSSLGLLGLTRRFRIAP